MNGLKILSGLQYCRADFITAEDLEGIPLFTAEDPTLLKVSPCVHFIRLFSFRIIFVGFWGLIIFVFFFSHLYDMYRLRNLPSVWKFICNVTLIPQNAKCVSSAMRSNICPIDPVHTRQTCCRNSIHLMEVVFSCVQMNGLLASNLPHVNTP